MAAMQCDKDEAGVFTLVSIQTYSRFLYYRAMKKI